MTEQHSESSDRTDLVERAEVELVDPEHLDEQAVDETVDHPAKVMRIGAMMKQLLEELRTMELDEPSRHRLRDIYETSVNELGGALSPDLREELDRLALAFQRGDPDRRRASDRQSAARRLARGVGARHAGDALRTADGCAAATPGLAGPDRSRRGEESVGEPAETRPGTYL